MQIVLSAAVAQRGRHPRAYVASPLHARMSMRRVAATCVATCVAATCVHDHALWRDLWQTNFCLQVKTRPRASRLPAPSWNLQHCKCRLRKWACYARIATRRGIEIIRVNCGHIFESEIFFLWAYSAMHMSWLGWVPSNAYEGGVIDSMAPTRATLFKV